jgi:transposase InsO family protein
MVRSLNEWHEYPISLACELAELSRSTYYYRSHKTDESQLVADVKTVVGQYVTYGTRRVRSQLRRAPYRYTLNRKRVQRIMRQEGLLRPVKRRKCRTTNSDHPYPRYANLVKDMVINEPEQVWVCDVTYVHLGAGFVYLAIVMDVFTRMIRGWQLSKTLDQELTLAALRMALSDRVPQIHQSDQGVQYAAHAYIDLLNDHQIRISMAAVGEAEENGYAERLMRTIKEEEVDLSEYRDYADARYQIGCFIEDVYNHKRIHSSLGYLTPAEFEVDWLSTLPERGTP